jgi:catechol 2,3-dioxygenase-like lactoylglutathione lyase family enzyme
MIVLGLDHVNLRVKDPAATTAFFCDVLGMTVDPRISSWLKDEQGNAVVHIGSADATYPSDAWRPFEARTDSGAVHHVALSCRGYEEVQRRLDNFGLEYRKNDVRDFGLRQIFVAEPGGVLLELNFRGD